MGCGSSLKADDKIEKLDNSEIRHASGIKHDQRHDAYIEIARARAPFRRFRLNQLECDEILYYFKANGVANLDELLALNMFEDMIAKTGLPDFPVSLMRNHIKGIQLIPIDTKLWPEYGWDEWSGHGHAEEIQWEYSLEPHADHYMDSRLLIDPRVWPECKGWLEYKERPGLFYCKQSYRGVFGDGCFPELVQQVRAFLFSRKSTSLILNYLKDHRLVSLEELYAWDMRDGMMSTDWAPSLEAGSVKKMDLQFKDVKKIVDDQAEHRQDPLMTNEVMANEVMTNEVMTNEGTA